MAVTLPVETEVSPELKLQALSLAPRIADQVYRIVEDLIPANLRTAAACRIHVAMSPSCRWLSSSPIRQAFEANCHQRSGYEKPAG